jgi:hypothetical protein
MRRIAAIAIAAGLCTAGAAHADILANWTFETSVPTTAGPHAAEAGTNAASSNATGFHLNPLAVYSNPAGNGSVESFSSNFWEAGDYYQFTTSTLGFQGITLQFDQNRSSTGPATFDVLYSTDGTNFFTLVDDYSVASQTWSSAVPVASTFGPYAGPAALDNQSTVYFRLVNQLTVTSTGTNRVDNVIISGTVIPAPGAAALMGLGVLVAARRRRA